MRMTPDSDASVWAMAGGSRDYSVLIIWNKYVGHWSRSCYMIGLFQISLPLPCCLIKWRIKLLFDYLKRYRIFLPPFNYNVPSRTFCNGWLNNNSLNTYTLYPVNYHCIGSRVSFRLFGNFESLMCSCLGNPSCEHQSARPTNIQSILPCLDR